MELPFAESWKIKMVEPIRKSTREEREQWIKEAHYNVFQLKSEQVYIDLITDSGTGAMSDRQWAGMMLGDESYAGATSFFKLKEMITKLTGFEYIMDVPLKMFFSLIWYMKETLCPATHILTPPKGTSRDVMPSH